MIMSMKKNIARRVSGTAMLIAGVFLFTACPREIGLGSAVDTQKPVISITSPEADSILNGNVTLTGTVTDDLAVKSVTVTFTSTSDPTLKAKSFEASIDAKSNSWSVTVDTDDAVKGLTDSNYEIIATATDNSNKSSTAARSFSIDNTAPTVLITSPSLYGENNRTQFCNQIRIEGEAFDVSEIDAVNVYLCNSSGNVVAGPKLAGGKTSWTALFSSEDLTALDDDGIYYFYAIATDKAGNNNTTFYHKADILGLPDGANPVPTIEEISRLDKGVTAGNSARVTAENLGSVRIGTGAEAIASGRTSSRGYPDFTYTTQASAAILWTNLSDDAATSVIGVGSAIFATIQPPSDNSAILLDSISVYIRTVNGATAGEWITQDSITKQKIGESVNVSINPKMDGATLQEGTYEVCLLCHTNSGASIGSNGQESSIGSEKGFMVNSDAPKVEESSIYTGSQPTTSFAQGIMSGRPGSAKGLSGRFLRSNGTVMPTLASGSFSVTCKNSAGDTVAVYTTDNGITYNGTTGAWSLPLSIGSGAGQLKDDTYTFSISGTISEALTMITRVVTVDTTVPQISLTAPAADSCITIGADGAGFTFQGNAADTGSGISTTYWCLDVAGKSHSASDAGTAGVANATALEENATPVLGKWYKFSTPTVFNLAPNLTGYAEQHYTAFVFAKDAAGYESAVKEVPFFIDNAVPVLSVEWPSDANLIRQNANGLTIPGKAYDTSGALEKVYVSFDGGTALMVADLSSGTHTSSNQASWKFPGSAVISEDKWTEGTHTLAFTVKDKAGRTSAVNQKTFTIDKTAPTVTIANLADGQVFSGMSTPISGTAIDSLSGVEKVEYSQNSGESWSNAVNSAGSWTINLGNLQSEDTQKIRVRAIDKAGNIGNAPAAGDITFSIDKANPQGEININVVDSESKKIGDTLMTKNGNFTLSGIANDAQETAGREATKVVLTYTKDGELPVTLFDTDAHWIRGKSEGITGKWSYDPQGSLTEGFYTFTLEVTDSVGKKTSVSKSFRYDNTAPVLVILTPAGNESFTNADISMNGNVSDSGSGVEKIYYTLDGSEPTSSSSTITPTGNSWTKPFDFNAEGVKTLKMYAVDKLGNKSETKAVTFSRDSTPPTLTVESTVPASGLTTNNDFALSGTASDTNGLASVTISDGTTTWTGDGTSGDITWSDCTTGDGQTRSCTWSLPFTTDGRTSDIHFDDGTKTFTITVKDVAGKTTSQTRTVTVDTSKPTISGVTLNTLVCLDESKYDRITVNAADVGTGLAGVFYQVVSEGSAAPSFVNDDGWSSLAQGSGSTWTDNIDFTGKTEGNYNIYVAAKDVAANRTLYGTATAVTLDAQKPVVTVISGDTAAGANNVALTVRVTDTNADSVDIEVAGTGKSATAPSISAPVTGTGYTEWNVTIPVSEYADGLYTITLTGKDKNGRVSIPATHQIRKDTTPPTANTITSPVTGKTGVDALFGESYIFRGEATDNAEGSGIAKIYYAFARGGESPVYTELATDGQWTITKSLNSGNSASSAGNLYEGSWKLYVKAEDAAGNCTSTPTVREFDIDMSDPTASITTIDGTNVTDLTKTQYSGNNQITFAGSGTDTNGIKSRKITIDGTEYDLGTTNGAWTYTYNRADANKDRLLTATVKVVDAVGKSSETGVSFYFDTVGPEVTITKPVNDGEAIVVNDQNKYTISGTAEDSGIGVDAANAAYRITNAGGTEVASGALNVPGASWNQSIDFTGKAEGSLTLEVTIQDKLGHRNSLTKPFYFDKSDPVLENINISSSGFTTNANFTLEGYAWDSNDIDCITVTDGTHTWSSGVSPATVTLDSKDRTAPGAVDDRNWHINFVVGSGTSGDFHIDDGTTTFTITAKDVAGKTITQTRTVTVDTSVPEITSVTPAGSAEIPAGMVYLDVSKYKKITVDAKDEGSGLAGVYYKVVTAGSAVPAFDDENGWTSLALSSNSGSSSIWTANIDFSEMSEGSYSIYAAAKDNAGSGNRTVYNKATAVTVDAKKPVTTIAGTSDAKNENVALTVTVEDTNPKEPVITVLCPKADGTAGGSALADPALTVSGPTAVTGGKQWTVTVPFGNAVYNADGVYTVIVKETDGNGRVADEKTHTIRRDTTAPTVSIVSPVEGKTGTNALFGSSYLFQGTANDNAGGSGLAKILYAFTTTGDAPSVGAWTELAMTDGSWSITKSLNEGKTAAAAGNLCEGTWYLHVIAEDKAGNRIVTTDRAVRSFDIDMNPPSLDITTADGNALSDLTKTYYSKANKLKLEGTASDSNGIASGKISIDGTEYDLGTTNGAWEYTYNRTTGNKDILHTVTVTVVDAVGKKAVKTTSFYFDTTAPSVTITTPVADEITSKNTYTLTGTVADVGSGVAADTATYIIKKGSDTVASGDMTVSGASWRAEDVQLGETGSEGKLDLIISIKDVLGTEATENRTFYKDLNPPELRVLSVSSSGLTTRDNFKIGGTAWDTNALESITITDGTTTWTSEGSGSTISLTPATEDPGDDESKWNWYMNFDVDGKTGYTHVDDGTKTYTITAKDVAGKTVSQTRTVTVDSTPPSVTAAATTASGGVDADKVFLDVSPYKPLTVTATDAGTGLTAVYYQIVTPAANAQDTKPADPSFTDSTEANWTSLALTGSDSWSGNADFTGKAEGKQYIFIAAKDKVGNRTVYETALDVTVDAQKPVISISGVPSQGQTDVPAAPKDAGANDVKFIVHIADTNPTAPVITVKDTSGKDMAPALNIEDPVIDATGKKWTVTIPFGNKAYETDGFYTFVINETDTRGRAATEVTHKIRKDTTAPTAVISTPADGRTGENALFGDSYRFTGTAADNTDGSGLAKILYAFTTSADTPANGAWIELAVTDENWTVTRELISGTAEPPAGKLSEGTWYLHVIAEDNAGNRTAVADRDIRSFDIDLNAPELSITKAGGKVLTDLTKTNYTNSNSITLEGSASDTNGVTSTSVTVKVGDGEAAYATYYATASEGHAAGTWDYTYIRTDDNKDQLLTATVTVTDVAGKTAVKTVPFYFDTQAPTVSITQPAPDALTSTNTYEIKGTVADVGAGVAKNTAGEIAAYAAAATDAIRNTLYDSAKAKYEIKNGAETVAKGLLPITGANWSVSVDLDDNSLAKKEGELTLTVYLEDILGNKDSSPITRTFYYDKTPPVIVENGVGASLITKDAFTFRGSASDSNALLANGIGAIQITALRGSDTVISETVDVDGSGAWSKKYTPGDPITVGTLTDGTYNFTFTVTDVAGRTAMTTSSVTVDKVAPEISKDGQSFLTDTPVVLNSTTTPENWFKKEYLSLKATVTDTAAGSVVSSGVSMVEYAVISNPASVPTDETWKGNSLIWNTMTMGASSVCTANAQVAGGTNYICIRAKDAAGNVTYSAQETAVHVDLSAPAITGVYTDAACTAALSNNTYMTSKKDLVLYLTVSEAANAGTPVQTGSGINELKVTINGNEVSAAPVAGATGKYLLSVAADNLDTYLGSVSTHIISAEISDKAGNSTTVSQLFTLKYDKTAPAAVFTKPAADAVVNKAIEVTGTASDDQSLESVILYLGDFTGETAPGDDDELAKFTGNAMYNWAYTLNTFDSVNFSKTYVPANDNMTLTVIAKDTAGNVTKEKLTFMVDQATDCPVISLTNVAFDGMTSDDPVRLTSGRTIYGSVTDDDGAVKRLEISKNGTDWVELTVNNGSFTTVVDSKDYLGDGRHTIQFRVTDKEGTLFTSPVLNGSDDKKSGDGKLYLIVDTTNPVAPTPKFSLTGTDGSWSSDLLTAKTFSKSLPAITSDAEAQKLPADVGADSFWIQQTAYDENGIDKVEVAVGDGNSSNPAYTMATPVKNSDGTLKTDEDGYNFFTYQVTHEQIAGLSSGTKTIFIKVTDKVGKEQTVNANFSVDNDAPAVEITSHAQNEHVKGEFYVGGTSNDAPKNKGAKSLIYKVTSSAVRPSDSDWAVEPVSNLTYAAHEIASDNLASWRIYFDNDFANDGYAHDRNFKQVLVSIPAYADYLKVNDAQKVVYSRNYDGHNADDAFIGPNNGYVQLYIHFKSTDAYGNTSYSSIPLMFDPQGDIPSVTITYPGATAYGWQHTTGSGGTRTASVIYTAKQTNLRVGDYVYTTLDGVLKNNDAGQITEIDAANNKIYASIDGTTLDYTWFGGSCIQGGVIRVQGTAIAEGANKISGVYLQIDPTYDPAYGFQWTDDNTAGNELMPYGGMVEAQRPADKKLSKKYTVEAITDSLKGISVGSSAAWSISLNESGEFDSTDSKTSNMIAVRAVVKDDKNNVSPITDNIIITVDSDTPRIGASEPLVLRQYSDNAAGTGTVTAEQEYTDDMWLKGEWWLEGSVEDSKGISKLTIAGTDVKGSSGTKTWNEGQTSASEGYTLHYKIGNTTNGEFGVLSYKISAEDNDDPHKTVEKTISVRYDNKKPVLEGTTDPDYNIKKEVVQKNGFYTLGSGIVEAGEGGNVQSGFERLALYFVRRGTGSGENATVDRLFDTYFVKKSVDGNTNNELALSGLNYDETDNLYYLQDKAVGHSGSSAVITLTAKDANIHKGGMVKIRGAYYIIKDMSSDGKTITLDRELADLGATETAKFALAMIVDNTQTEKAGTLDANGYYKPSNSDDGDCMLESVNTSNGTTVWEANINSRNIPDGAIEIHYVAFDKAGNSAHDFVMGTVANNAPRLAGVSYGVDNNGDGKVEGSELKDKLFAMENGKYIDSELRTSYILKKSGGEEIQDNDAIVKIKGAVKVIPEIVGGNGDLFYTWSVTENGAAAPYYAITTTSPLKNGTAQISGSDYTGKGLAEEIKEAGILLTMKDLLKGNIKDGNAGKNQVFTFTIWDSTEGMTPGSLVEGVGSQRAVIKMVADVKLKDDVKPSALITPFYWQSKSKNSVYTTTDENENIIMQGHIDLSADLPEGTGSVFTAGTGALDRDDKVSGAIVIEGTAHDDTLLSGLYMKIYSGTEDKFTFTGVNAIAGTDAIAVRTKPASGNSPLIGYYPVASYSSGWTGSGDYDTNGWHFEAGDDEFDENGHTTHWKLTLNTEKLSSKVIADLKVSVLTTDMGAPTLNGETITYKENVTEAAVQYQFDVVPYIRNIKTSLSESAGAEFARSATGRYSVRNGEEVKVYGWNLDTGTQTKAGKTVYSTTVALGNSALTVTGAGTDKDGTYVAATIGSTSGNIKVTVADIDSLNNLNSNDAAGTHTDSQGNTVNVTDANYATYAYNRVPNGITNNRLSDDVSIWVWDFGAFVDGTNITSPMMKMGPDSKYYMSYGNGIQQMMVNLNGSTRSVDYSYNKFHNTNVAFDDNGRIWAVGMNTDRIRDDSSRYVLYAPLNGTMPDKSGTTSTEYVASSTTKRHLELAYNGATKEYNINRTKDAKLITATVNGETIIATSYFDANNTINPVKVRFGKYGREVNKADVTFTYSSAITTYKNTGTTRKPVYEVDKTVTGWTTTNTTNFSNCLVIVNGTEYTLTRASYTNSTGGTSYYYTISNLPTATSLSKITVYNNKWILTGGLTGQIGNGVTGSSYTPSITMTQSNDPTKTDSSASGYHIVASEDTNIKGGAYTAVGIVPSTKGTNGYVGVMAWYDAQARKLAFSYNTAPESAYIASDDDEQWMKHAIYIDSASYTGWYVDMIVDDNGGIHFAYYDSGKGDLKYAYLSSFEDTKADVVTVDSYLSVGTNISMTIRKENDRQVPYIYYYNASSTQTTNSVRVAWQQDSTLGAGAENDKYTGSWEVMTIPTEGIPVDATVCGGAPTSGDYGNKVVLGYMTDSRYERAVLQK